MSTETRFPFATVRWVLAGGAALVFASATPADEDANGAQLYQEYCSVCHGEQGDGQSRARFGLNPPPRDFTKPGLKDQLSRDRMIQAVTYGVPGTAMAAWETRLSDEQIERVVRFVRSEFMVSAEDADSAADAAQTASKEPSPPQDAGQGYHGGSMPGSGTQPTAEAEGHHDGEGDGGHDHNHMADPEKILNASLPRGLEGDATAGEALYEDNCVACHGEDGGGDGPRAYFIYPRPRDFTTGPPISRPDLFSGIAHGVRGREMPAWNKVMSDQQIANVTEYVFQEFQRPRLRARLGDTEATSAATSEQSSASHADHDHEHDEAH